MYKFYLVIIGMFFLGFTASSQGMDLPIVSEGNSKNGNSEKVENKEIQGQISFDIKGILTINGKAHNVTSNVPLKHIYTKGDKFHFRTEDDLINKTLATGKGEYIFADGFDFRFRFKEKHTEESEKKKKDKARKKLEDQELKKEEEYARYVASIIMPLNNDFIDIEDKIINYDGREVGMDAFQISTKEVSKRQYKLFQEMSRKVKNARGLNDVENDIVSVVLNSKSKIASPKEKRKNVDWSSDEEGLIRDVESSLEHPVSFISYDEAKAFCEWLNNMDGNHYYRLPYSYEWDYVMSKGFYNDYPWPEDIDEMEIEMYANLMDLSVMTTFSNVDENCHKWHDGYAFKSPVASYKPNGYGVYDMAGNVAEWTEDSSRNRPGFKIIKGGSFFVVKEKSKLNTSRMKAASFDAGMRHYGIGMRLVRVPK